MNDPLVLTEDWKTPAGLRVRTIVLNRPDKANAMNAAMQKQVAAAVADSPAQLHVLRSASERVFCAGADIAQFVEGSTALAQQEHALLEMLEALASSTIPLVAVARGKASGAGALLLTLADAVLAAENVEIACPEIRFGMYPVIVEAVLQSRVSPALAARMCLGQPLTASQAFETGLVTEVLPCVEFASQSAQRLDFFLARAAGLTVARKARLLSQPAAALMHTVRTVAPLMAENYEKAGVREQMLAYLAGLGRRA